MALGDSQLEQICGFDRRETKKTAQLYFHKSTPTPMVQCAKETRVNKFIVKGL